MKLEKYLDWLIFSLIVLIFIVEVFANERSQNENIDLALPVQTALLQSYSSMYYEIYCYSDEGLLFHDWSETDLVPYYDRLEYYSVTKNKVISVYNATLCKSVPPDG